MHPKPLKNHLHIRYDYEELADRLIPCLQENEYNYVEFLPLAEHPSNYSWRYQTTGYFSPTSRYGSAACLKEFSINSVGQSEWGTCNFMHSRGEVRSLFQSAVNYWIREFYFDGNWQGDPARGINKNAVALIRRIGDRYFFTSDMRGICFPVSIKCFKQMP